MVLDSADGPGQVDAPGELLLCPAPPLSTVVDLPAEAGKLLDVPTLGLEGESAALDLRHDHCMVIPSAYLSISSPTVA
ncbi:MAG TPA: hypothetical protein VGK63_00890, partial [Candidatus Limnocylindrales bacterium]